MPRLRDPFAEFIGRVRNQNIKSSLLRWLQCRCVDSKNPVFGRNYFLSLPEGDSKEERQFILKQLLLSFANYLDHMLTG